jgi:hypothetical protein
LLTLSSDCLDEAGTAAFTADWALVIEVKGSPVYASSASFVEAGATEQTLITDHWRNAQFASHAQDDTVSRFIK